MILKDWYHAINKYILHGHWNMQWLKISKSFIHHIEIWKSIQHVCIILTVELLRTIWYYFGFYWSDYIRAFIMDKINIGIMLRQISKQFRCAGLWPPLMVIFTLCSKPILHDLQSTMYSVLNKHKQPHIRLSQVLSVLHHALFQCNNNWVWPISGLS